MAEDIRLATSKELSEVKTELEKKANVSDIELKGYLKRQIVGTLPSVPVIYDFEDGQARFTVPKLRTAAKGVSEILEDNGNKYQSVCSTGAAGTSTTIGSNSIVYSEMDLSSIIGAESSFILEFDFKMNSNGRMRISIGDLNTLREITGDTKYNTNGIAADIFSASNSTFQICGSGDVHESFFGVWLHCKFEIDTNTKTVNYSVKNSSDETDTQSASVDFRGSCNSVTGIALYTWLADDAVCFDNIKIHGFSEINEIDDRTIYLVKKDNVYLEYIYIDGIPVQIGGNEVMETINNLMERISELEREVLS